MHPATDIGAIAARWDPIKMVNLKKALAISVSITLNVSQLGMPRFEANKLQL